ncbi:hypothetical protein ACQVPL_21230 [Bacillus hominis]|uniref:hypothetical protein n=1 Tax=Bacillus hominis TaxID=2817478 RepID=UPI003D6470BE
MMTIPMPKLNTRVLSIYVTSLFESKKHSGWSAFLLSESVATNTATYRKGIVRVKSYITLCVYFVNEQVPLRYRKKDTLSSVFHDDKMCQLLEFDKTLIFRLTVFLNQEV